LHRPDVKLDDEAVTTAAVAEVELRTPGREKPLGTPDPETSLTIVQDKEVDEPGVSPLGLETSPAAPLLPYPQIESA